MILSAVETYDNNVHPTADTNNVIGKQWRGRRMMPSVM